MEEQEQVQDRLHEVNWLTHHLHTNIIEQILVVLDIPMYATHHILMRQELQCAPISIL